MSDSQADEQSFRGLTAALVLLLSLQLLAFRGPWIQILASVAGGAALTASLWWVHRRPLLFWVGVVLLIPALGGGWLLSDRAVTSVGGSPFHAPFFFYLATTVLVRLLQSKRATEDTLLGAACAYILLALAFASAYEAVEFFSPGAIAGLDTSGATGTVFSQLSYFSLVTLTTLGYGDLSPVHPFCESLAIVESVVGVLFPALIVARIVGAYSAEGTSTLGRPESTETRESHVAHALFVLLPSIVLALPWLQRTAWGSVAVSGLLLSVTVAGVYFISGRRRVLIVGIGMAMAACALRILGGEYLAIAAAIEVTLIGTVVVRMSSWFFRHREATTGVVLAAACIYWLIGIGFADAYQLLGQWFPSAIEGSPANPLGTMIYFSFMTLTTTGYGDFTPAVPIARGLASLEAFIGVFYPAIVIGKLVSLYGTRE